MATITYSFSNVIPEFVVNHAAANNQSRPDVVTQTNGNLFFTFESDSSFDPDFQDTLFRRFSSVGVALDASDRGVSAGANTNDEENSAVAILSNGNVVVVNEDNGGDAEDDVEFHIFTGSGVTVSAQNTVLAEGQAADSQTDPDVAALAGGGFVVVHVDQLAGSAANTNAQFVIYNNDGSLRAGPTTAGGGNSVLPVSQPAVTALVNGNFVVSWREDVGGGDFNVKLKIYGPTGAPASAEFAVSGQTDDQSQPALAALPNGRFAVVFNDQTVGSATNSDLILRIYDAGGAPVGVPTLVNGDVGADLMSDPDIAVISDKYLLVSYTSNRNGGDDIFGRVFDFTGVAVGPEFNLEEAAGAQTASAVASIGGGRFVATWRDAVSAGDDNSGSHIAAQVTQLIRTTAGTANDESLNGDDIVDIIFGGGGVDLIDGGLGKDTLIGGPGRDRADYSNRTESIVVFLDGANNVTVQAGGVSEDTIREIEDIYSGSANDTLVGDGLGNTLYGSSGADFLFSNSFNPDGAMKASVATDVLAGGHGDDGLFAGDGADTLFGEAGNDGIVGGAGADTMIGGAGNDFIFGGSFSAIDGSRLPGSGNDTLNGGDGNDGLYGFDGDDQIEGGGDNDYVEGGDGTDVINGGAGSDYLLGQGDADTINGGTGFDYLYGGLGADIFVFKLFDSADWALDFSAAQDDRVRFEGFGFANFGAVPLVDLSTPGNPAVRLTFAGPGGVDQLTIFGVTLAQLNAGNVLVA